MRMPEKDILIPSPLGWAPAVSMASLPSPTPMAAQTAYPDPYRLFAGIKGGITQWNPSELVGRRGLRLYDQMRRDEQIKAAIAFKKRAIIAAGWEIVSPDGMPDDWEPRLFVEWCFDRLQGSMSDRIMMMLTSVEYGFSVAELVWGETNDDGMTADPLTSGPLTSGPYRGKWPLEDIVALKPHSINFDQDDKGHILNIVQRYTSGPVIELPPEKCVLMTYQSEWSNPYGRSDFEACYDDFWGKTNAKKWLAMLLERFGIPPIFALYNYNKYTGSTLDSLKNIITNLQAGTASIIPRMSKEDLDMWTPTLASQVADVFIPALDRYDRGMARGILMPNLIGGTPEQHSGSFARAMVNFDVFMFAVDSLRTQVEECINDQIIWRMMQLNYPTDGDQYPRFQFKPLTQDSRIALMDGWTKMVTAKAVIPREADEPHIREIFGFPDEDSPPLNNPQAAPDVTGTGDTGGGSAGIGSGVGVGAGVRAGVSASQEAISLDLSNPCHGPNDGRFCPTEGSGSAGGGGAAGKTGGATRGKASKKDMGGRKGGLEDNATDKKTDEVHNSLGTEKMSSDEASAFDRYKGADFLNINPKLRGEADLNAGVRRTTDALDGVFDRASLPGEAVVYRGVGSGLSDKLAGLKVGATITDKSYVSTSISASRATSFGNAVIRVRLPSGSKAVSYSSVYGKGFKGLSFNKDFEHEVLLPRGTTMRFAGKAKDVGAALGGSKVYDFDLVAGQR